MDVGHLLTVDWLFSHSLFNSWLTTSLLLTFYCRPFVQISSFQLRSLGQSLEWSNLSLLRHTCAASEACHCSHINIAKLECCSILLANRNHVSFKVKAKYSKTGTSISISRLLFTSLTAASRHRIWHVCRRSYSSYT